MTEGLRCEKCGAPVDRTIEFCTECGTYLGWAERDAGPEPVREADLDTAPVAVAPAASRGQSAALPPAPATAGPRPFIAGGKICPSCSVSNIDTRTFCSHCGTALGGAGAESTQPVPVVSSSRTGRGRLPVVAVCTVVIVVIAVGIVLLGRGGDDKNSVASPSTSAMTSVATTVETGAPAPKRIDPATITASASSTLPDDGRYSYGVKNTLDGNLETAWNDGVPGPGVGEKLTYRFRTPVTLISIGLVNGYASTPELFKENARMRNIVFVTDTGRFPATLPDSSARQDLSLAFGRTMSVVIIEVVSVYPGSKYEDLALTEIDFTAIG